MWGPYNLPPVSRWPGQRHGTGSLLLQQPPGRISWCFSGHALCSCSRLLLWAFFFLAFTHRSWQFPTHSRNQDGPAQGQRRCSNTISIPLTASLTPCPAETPDTTCTDQMDLSSSSTPSPKPSSILHRVTPVPRSDPSCKYQSHQSRQSTAAESLGERHRRDSSQHGELSPRCSTLPAHTLCPGCHTEPLSPSY